jgi:hypothetical protein
MFVVNTDLLEELANFTFYIQTLASDIPLLAGKCGANIKIRES